MSQDLHAVIIGAGRVAPGLARAIENAPGVSLVGVADNDFSRAEALGAKLGVRAIASYQEFLNDPHVELAVLALPHWLHHRVAIDCCKAGKHVYVEKPLANTVEEADEMIATAEAHQVRLFAAHTQRFMASAILARQMLERGDIGAPVYATDTWYKDFGVAGRPAWFLDRSKGGGMWLMNGAHMIDRTCWMLNSEVVAVKAWIGNPIYHLQADDSSLAHLQLKNGLNCAIIHSGFKKGVGKCEVEILGTEGMLKVDTYGSRLWQSLDDQYQPVEVQKHDAFTYEMTRFIEALQTGGELPVPISWGRHMVQVLCACEESSQTGREVVLS
ncbi:MAG TPA: Gfo/Idh/MocA family oxidoreductase [Chloroflexota bacterium]|nr:Gfo/Idh/MocA family oxidoreductase [Chloroflexota bacterium]